MAKAKPEKPFNSNKWSAARKHSFIMSALRRAQWPVKYEAIRTAYVKDGINPKSGRPCKLHLCPVCKALFPQSQMQADHLIPVIPTSGFDSWDGVIKRLYCELDGYEPLCKECHKTRTKKQNEERKAKKSVRAVNSLGKGKDYRPQEPAPRRLGSLPAA